jgi:uncharacterized iron-regulated membrane protein
MNGCTANIGQSTKRSSVGRLKSATRLVHRWTGVVIAVYIILIGLTGSLLVWQRELDAWLNPEMLKPVLSVSKGQQVETASLSAIRDAGLAAIVQKAGKNAGDCALIWPIVPATSFRMFCAAVYPRYTRHFDIFIHPETARVTGIRDRETFALDRLHFVRTLHDFHSDLLLGDVGLKIVGVNALILTGMTISGLLLWWPRNRRFVIPALKIKLWSLTRRSLYEWHRTIGVTASILILTSAFSGLYLSFPDEIDWVAESFGGMAPVPELSQLHPATITQDGGDISLLVHIANTALPGGKVTEISLPSDAMVPTDVSILLPGTPRAFDGTSSVIIDRSTSRVLHVRNVGSLGPTDRILESLFPLHSGEFLRTVGRILTTLEGLLLALLASSAIWLFLIRQRSGGQKATARRNLKRE